MRCVNAFSFRVGGGDGDGGALAICAIASPLLGYDDDRARNPQRCKSAKCNGVDDAATCGGNNVPSRKRQHGETNANLKWARARSVVPILRHHRRQPPLGVTPPCVRTSCARAFARVGMCMCLALRYETRFLHGLPAKSTQKRNEIAVQSSRC